MKILVTGATGNVGRAAVALLVQKGHTITVVGRRAGLVVDGATYAACDITDYPELARHARGCDAIVHLAAYPNPTLATPEELFRVNCQGTFNVYQAAVEAGIRRVVNASSINALGLGFGARPSRIQYVPVDEDHPTYTSDTYSFSKNVVESIGAYFDRREGISGVSMRLPAVVPHAYSGGDRAKMLMEKSREQFAALGAMSDEERSRTISGWMERIAETRRNRWMERPPEGWKGMFPDNPIMGGWNDLWVAVDERDSAQAIERAATVDYEGHHVLFVNDRVNRVGIPSVELIETFYPGVAHTKLLRGYETLVSIDRARKLLGYEPEYSFERLFEGQ